MARSREQKAQDRMLKAWRRAAVAALAGCAAIAAQLMVIAPAQAAAPTITINATSKFPVVTNDVFVFYHASNGAGTATIHGKITGATAGDVATLYAQRFPYTKPAAPLASKTLTASTQTYSFKVTPPLATHYMVRLFPNSTSHTQIASSNVQKVFVAANRNFSTNFSCPLPACHVFLHVTEFVPSSAIAAEMGKHVYPYFGLRLANTQNPPPFPTSVILNADRPAVSQLHRVNANEFTFRIAWTFTVGNHSASWIPFGCQRDSETKDGLGLPGSHGCGATSIPVSTPYVG